MYRHLESEGYSVPFSLLVKKRFSIWLIACIILVGSILVGDVFRVQAARVDSNAFINQFQKANVISKTTAKNGDHNPYAVTVIKRSIGKLVEGNILVSNFDNKEGKKGKGSTLVQITPDGSVSDFAEIKTGELPSKCSGGIGLTTGLVILKRGWVIVSSLPTANGDPLTAQEGCLIVLDTEGNVVETITAPQINGPWDIAVADFSDVAALFVSNTLNGTVEASPNKAYAGTVVRIRLDVPYPDDGVPEVSSMTVIGSEFAERTDKAKMVYGPTGLAFAYDGTLYVADSLNNRISAIHNALFRMYSSGTGDDVSSNGDIFLPEGLIMAPNGNIIVANHNGKLVEVSPEGTQVGVKDLHEGDYLTGLAVTPNEDGLYYVDDCEDTLKLYA
jgi:sugar lactone lactonase YvrE